MTMFTPAGTGGRGRGSGVGRRVLAVALVLLVVAGVVTVAWQLASQPNDKVTSQPKVTCPEPQPTHEAVPAAEVKVHVYNATDRAGLAARVARMLRQRGFRIGKVDNDPSQRAVTGVAEVRHGPAGADAARTVAAQVGDAEVGTVVAVPDERRNPSVDLVLGASFRSLLSVEAAADVLSPSPEPVPAGC